MVHGYKKLIVIFCSFMAHTLLSLDQLGQFQNKSENDLAQSQESDIDSGNWYEKLQWWKKAKPLYDEVKANVTAIQDEANIIEKKLVEGKDALSGAYTTLRIKPVVIDQEINKIIAQIKTQLSSEPKNEKEAQEHVQKADIEKLLEQLKDSLSLLPAFNEQFSKSIPDIVSSQLKMANSYLDRSLNNFEKIENILDDQKARYLYEEIEGFAENSRTLLSYFQVTLPHYIDGSIVKIKQMVPIIEKNLEDAEKNNIILRPKSEEQLKKEKEAAQKKEQEEAAKPKGWFASIWMAIKSFFVGIWQWIKSWFVKT